MGKGQKCQAKMKWGTWVRDGRHNYYRGLRILSTEVDEHYFNVT